MERTSSLLERLKGDYPEFRFLRGETYRWSPQEAVIYYDMPLNEPELLHELAHAILKHQTYQHDIELLQKEQEAWQYAGTILATNYSIPITHDLCEAALDTYRDWLHARSACPECSATGLQTQTGTYQCILCRCQWRANDARICMLRRFKL